MNKVKILFLAANPKETGALSLDEEIREITGKIQSAEFRDAFEIVSQWAVRPLDLLQALQQHKPTIVHFSGHGSESGEIILVDKDGGAKPIEKNALVSLFTSLKGTTRLVVFNACYSKLQAEAVAEAVGCALGTNRAISDEAAITFAGAFYQALAFEQTIQTAFDLARTALMLEGIPEEDTMELLSDAEGNSSGVRFTKPHPGALSKPPTEHTDRVILLKDIGGLYPADFANLVAFIPGAARVLSKFLSVPEQASHLISWAESSKGPGLAAVAQAYESLD